MLLLCLPLCCSDSELNQLFGIVHFFFAKLKPMNTFLILPSTFQLKYIIVSTTSSNSTFSITFDVGFPFMRVVLLFSKWSPAPPVSAAHLNSTCSLSFDSSSASALRDMFFGPPEGSAEFSGAFLRRRRRSGQGPLQLKKNAVPQLRVGKFFTRHNRVIFF